MRPTIKEFANDPLGDKKRKADIESLNDALKSEIYAHKLNKERAKDFCQRVGLDANNNQYGR